MIAEISGDENILDESFHYVTLWQIVIIFIMSVMENNKRPVYLDLTRIDMPVMAVLSVAHRITGILMFLSIPFVIYLLDLSLGSPQGYEAAISLLDSGLFRLIVLLLLWCFAHHFFAGIRYFMLDLDIGVDVKNGRKSAWCVLGAGLAVTLVGLLFML